MIKIRLGKKMPPPWDTADGAYHARQPCFKWNSDEGKNIAQVLSNLLGRARGSGASFTAVGWSGGRLQLVKRGGS